jgi:hypothetical protein
MQGVDRLSDRHARGRVAQGADGTGQRLGQFDLNLDAGEVARRLRVSLMTAELTTLPRGSDPSPSAFLKSDSSCP